MNNETVTRVPKYFNTELETSQNRYASPDLNQILRPQAISTELRPKYYAQNRLSDLSDDDGSLFNLAADDREQSSLGLVPNKLLSETFLLNKSRKYSSLPSIPESPKHFSPTEDFVSQDDVFEDVMLSLTPKSTNTTIDNQGGVPQQLRSLLIRRLLRLPLSNSSKVEFRDDQISAHSSTADTYDTNNNVLSQKKMQISDVVQKIEELCVSSLIETDIFEHNSYLTYIMGDINIISWNALHRGNQGVVILPPEVRLETCCIGTCAKCKLFLQNVSPKWMESRVVIQKLTCNGQNWDMMTTPSVLSLTPPRAIEPLSVYEIDIVFIPPTEGTWESMLQFFFRDLSLISSHVASDSPSIDWCSYPTIRVTAKAKKPNLSASPESIIDFGILPEESLSMIHIKLSNNEDCSLPVHLIMEGTSVTGHGFYFPQLNISPSSRSIQDTPSCISKCILRCGEDQIPVAFKAPTLSHTRDHFRVFTSSFHLELNSPGPSPVLKTICLRATVGLVKLYIQPQDEILNLTYPSSATRDFPLLNAGALPVNVELNTEDTGHLSVIPKFTSLTPGEQTRIQITFHPLNLCTPLQSSLNIKVLPEGPAYKIAVNGNYDINYKVPSLRNDGHYNLYSDRRYIYYGVVNLQESLEHHIVLQNMSHSEELNLEISVEVNDADNDAPRHIFHLKPLWMHHSNCASNGCQLCGQKYLTLRPGDKHSLTVIFVPQAVVQYCAKLIIRPQKVDLPNTTLVSSDVKFSVPLWGYGGIAALSFTGLKSTEQLSPFHWYIPLPTNQPLVISSSNRQHHHHHPIYELLFPSTQQSMHFTMQNCGHRAAFIKILLSHDKDRLVPLPSWVSISVQPDSYVLEKGHFLTVEINSYLPIHLGTDVYIIIIYGEEVLRQRFLFTRNNVDIFENSVLLNYLRLHETFTNESSNLTGILSADSFCPDFKSNITELVASLKLVWIRMYLGSLSSPVLSTSLSEGLVSVHKSTFEPMNPE